MWQSSIGSPPHYGGCSTFEPFGCVHCLYLDASPLATTLAYLCVFFGGSAIIASPITLPLSCLRFFLLVSYAGIWLRSTLWLLHACASQGNQILEGVFSVYEVVDLIHGVLQGGRRFSLYLILIIRVHSLFIELVKICF